MHLGDGGLVHVEQRHAVALRPFQLPGVVVDAAPAAVLPRLGLHAGYRHVAVRAGEIVAGGERPPGAAQDHAVDGGVVVRLPQRLVEFGLQLQGERVQLLRPVQRDAGAAIRHFVVDAVEIAHVFSSKVFCRRERLRSATHMATPTAQALINTTATAPLAASSKRK